jgi:ABC-type glycerol-3-phosphate transport system substrate-binding protein
MLENHDLERLDSELRIQAASHQPRLIPGASARIQKRVYRQLRRAIMVQRTIKPAVTYLMFAIIIVLAIAGFISLNQSLFGKTTSPVISTATQTRAPSTPERPTFTRTPTPGPKIVKYYAATYNSGAATNPGMPEAGVITSLVHTFNAAHPDIKITLVENINIPSDDVLASMAGQADCFTLPVPFWYQSDSAVLDINTLVNTESPNFITDFDFALLADFRRNNKLIALPAVSAPIEVMYYNLDLLSRHGIEPPSLDWTYADFVHDIQTFSASTDGTTGFVFDQDDLFFRGRDVYWVDPTADPLSVHMNSVGMNNSLTWLVDLKDSGALILETSDNRPEVEAKIRAGKVAFWASSTGWLNTTFMDTLPTFQVRTVTMPKIEGYRYPVYWYNERGHFISARSPNVQACWSWFKFLSEKPEAFVGIPGRLSLLPQWEAFIGMSDAKVYETEYGRGQRYDYNTPYYTIGAWPLNWWVNQAILSAFDGQDIQQSLDTAQVKAEAYISCWDGLDVSQYYGSKLVDQIQHCARQVDPVWPFSP